MNTNHNCKEAVAKIQKLNPSVAVYAQAHKLISSPDIQLEQLADIIKLDTALTANIIRLSNSAGLGGTMPTVSLLVAMNRVGLGEVKRYLGLSVSRSLLYRNLKYYLISAYDYWSSSVSMAILMELLSQRIKEDKNDAYTVGILHATGRLVINQILDNLENSIYWDKKMPIEKWEMDSVGLTYSTAGTLLLKAWGFPPSLCDIIENQLSPERMSNPSTMLKALNFGIRFLPSTGVEFTIEKWKFPDSDPFLKEFDISPDELQKIVLETKQKHAEAQASLLISN